MSAEFIRFVLVGVIGFWGGGGGTWMLEPVGTNPVVAGILVLLAVIVVTWKLNRTFTFEVDMPKRCAERAPYAPFALSGVPMYLLLYSGLVLLGMHPLVALAVAILVLPLCGFFAYRRRVFR